MSVVFQAFKAKGSSLRQPFFMGVHHVQNDHLPSAMAKQTQCGKSVFQVVDQEVGHQHEDASLAALLKQPAQAVRHCLCRAGFQFLNDLLQALDACGRAAGRQQGSQGAVEHGQSNLILASTDHVTQCRGEVLHVLKLRPFTPFRTGGCKQHGAAGVESQRAMQIRLFLMEADKGLARSGKHLPVEPPQVLGARVLTKIDEFPRTTLLSRLVSSGVGSLDAMTC